MESLKHLVNSRINGMKSLILTKTPQDKIVSDLQEASIPVSTDPCRSCPNPCDVGHLEYPSMFDIDTASDMLGSVKPYMRQVSRTEFHSRKRLTIVTNLVGRSSFLLVKSTGSKKSPKRTDLLPIYSPQSSPMQPLNHLQSLLGPYSRQASLLLA